MLLIKFNLCLSMSSCYEFIIPNCRNVKRPERWRNLCRYCIWYAYDNPIHKGQTVVHGYFQRNQIITFVRLASLLPDMFFISTNGSSYSIIYPFVDLLSKPGHKYTGVYGSYVPIFHDQGYSADYLAVNPYVPPESISDRHFLATLARHLEVFYRLGVQPVSIKMDTAPMNYKMICSCETCMLLNDMDQCEDFGPVIF